VTIAVESDFRDFYDHAFSTTFSAARPHTCSKPWTCPNVWQRNMRTAWGRRADFRHMSEAGLHIPRTGERSVWRADDEVVVYEDEHAHCGNGKRRAVAEDMKPGEFASAFVSCYHEPVARSYRAVAVGHNVFWIRYTSNDSWRSNCGDVEIVDVDGRHKGDVVETKAALLRLQAIRRTPLVAVDFVDGGLVWLTAIDLNTAPGLRGTPVESLMSAVEVVNALDDRWQEINP
jgi:hypothetical protein